MMMEWVRCKDRMPGERYDASKYPDEALSRFLICWHKEDKDMINPLLQVDEALLLDGKFLCKGPSKDWGDTVITHWLRIVLP